MLTQLLITTLALTTLALIWVGVSRLTYVAEPGASGDWMEGRWGCSDCDDQDACVLKGLVPHGESCDAKRSSEASLS